MASKFLTGKNPQETRALPEPAFAPDLLPAYARLNLHTPAVQARCMSCSSRTRIDDVELLKVRETAAIHCNCAANYGAASYPNLPVDENGNVKRAYKDTPRIITAVPSTHLMVPELGRDAPVGIEVPMLSPLGKAIYRFEEEYQDMPVVRYMDSICLFARALELRIEEDMDLEETIKHVRRLKPQVEKLRRHKNHKIDPEQASTHGHVDEYDTNATRYVSSVFMGIFPNITLITQSINTLMQTAATINNLQREKATWVNPTWFQQALYKDASTGHWAEEVETNAYNAIEALNIQEENITQLQALLEDQRALADMYEYMKKTWPKHADTVHVQPSKIQEIYTHNVVSLESSLRIIAHYVNLSFRRLFLTHQAQTDAIRTAYHYKGLYPSETIPREMARLAGIEVGPSDSISDTASSSQAQGPTRARTLMDLEKVLDTSDSEADGSEYREIRNQELRRSLNAVYELHRELQTKFEWILTPPMSMHALHFTSDPVYIIIRHPWLAIGPDWTFNEHGIPLRAPATLFNPDCNKDFPYVPEKPPASYAPTDKRRIEKWAALARVYGPIVNQPYLCTDEATIRQYHAYNMMVSGTPVYMIPVWHHEKTRRYLATLPGAPATWKYSLDGSPFAIPETLLYQQSNRDWPFLPLQPPRSYMPTTAEPQRSNGWLKKVIRIGSLANSPPEEPLPKKEVLRWQAEHAALMEDIDERMDVRITRPEQYFIPKYTKWRFDERGIPTAIPEVCFPQSATLLPNPMTIPNLAPRNFLRHNSNRQTFWSRLRMILMELQVLGFPRRNDDMLMIMSGARAIEQACPITEDAESLGQAAYEPGITNSKKHKQTSQYCRKGWLMMTILLGLVLGAVGEPVHQQGQDNQFKFVTMTEDRHGFIFQPFGRATINPEHSTVARKLPTEPLLNGLITLRSLNTTLTQTCDGILKKEYKKTKAFTSSRFRRQTRDICSEQNMTIFNIETTEDLEVIMDHTEKKERSFMATCTDAYRNNVIPTTHMNNGTREFIKVEPIGLTNDQMFALQEVWCLVRQKKGTETVIIPSGNRFISHAEKPGAILCNVNGASTTERYTHAYYSCIANMKELSTIMIQTAYAVGVIQPDSPFYKTTENSELWNIPTSPLEETTTTDRNKRDLSWILRTLPTMSPSLGLAQLFIRAAMQYGIPIPPPKIPHEHNTASNATTLNRDTRAIQLAPLVIIGVGAVGLMAAYEGIKELVSSPTMPATEITKLAESTQEANLFAMKVANATERLNFKHNLAVDHMEEYMSTNRVLQDSNTIMDLARSVSANVITQTNTAADIVTAGINGHIHPLLVSEGFLNDTENRLGFTRGKRLSRHISDIKTAVYTKDNDFYFVMRIPIEDMAKESELFRTIPIPFWVNQTRLSPIGRSEYIAMSKHKFLTFPLSPAEFTICHESPGNCIAATPAYTSRDDICGITNYKQISHSCKHEKDHDQGSWFFMADRTLYFAVNESIRLDVNCAGLPASDLLPADMASRWANETGKFTVPEGCEISTSDGRVTYTASAPNLMVSPKDIMPLYLRDRSLSVYTLMANKADIQGKLEHLKVANDSLLAEWPAIYQPQVDDTFGGRIMGFFHKTLNLIKNIINFGLIAFAILMIYVLIRGKHPRKGLANAAARIAQCFRTKKQRKTEEHEAELTRREVELDPEAMYRHQLIDRRSNIEVTPPSAPSRPLIDHDHRGINKDLLDF